MTASASVTALFAEKPPFKLTGEEGLFDKARRPWENWPYPLVSWWDMEQFSAGPLYRCSIQLGQIKTALDHYQQESRNKNHPGYLPAFLKKQIAKALRQLGAECQELDFKGAVLCVKDGLLDLKREFVTPADVRRIYEILDNTMRHDMEAVLFFHVDWNRRDFYAQQMLFGPKVADAFPRSYDDIREAGTCYAFGRFTACVFHLMRVMELGVQAFGAMLGVDFPESKEWGKILNIAAGKIEEQTKARPRGAKDPEIVAWNQILAHLNSVKIGWRNPTMHPNESYDAEQAKELLGLVETLMKSLAKHVKPSTAGPTLVK
jgi:hypothetical protein